MVDVSPPVTTMRELKTHGMNTRFAILDAGYLSDANIIDLSATVKGGGVKGVTNEFPLRPGRGTLARLGERRDRDGFRMLVATGEAVETDLFVRGNPIRIRFDAGCEQLKDVVIGQGWEHHYVMSYGDITQELKDFCRILDIDYTLVQ